jgi:hypothetical protein
MPTGTTNRRVASLQWESLMVRQTASTGFDWLGDGMVITQRDLKLVAFAFISE